MTRGSSSPGRTRPPRRPRRPISSTMARAPRPPAEHHQRHDDDHRVCRPTGGRRHQRQHHHDHRLLLSRRPARRPLGEPHRLLSGERRVGQRGGRALDDGDGDRQPALRRLWPGALHQRHHAGLVRLHGPARRHRDDWPRLLRRPVLQFRHRPVRQRRSLAGGRGGVGGGAEPLRLRGGQPRDLPRPEWPRDLQRG